jgi:putative transcriptional regulator
VAKQGVLFDRLKEGLEHGIRDAHGEITLRRTEMTAPDAAKPLTAAEIRGVRRRFGMTQPMFARVLNVSSHTLKSWESGDREPSQAALRLLQVIRAQPSIVQEIVGWDRQPARTGA